MTSHRRQIIVTGAGSGIGAAVVRAFVEAGDHVHLADLSGERLAAVTEALPPEQFTNHVVDVVDAERMTAFVADVAARGPIDVLVCSAGVFDAAAGVETTSFELWNRIIDINLTGTYHAVKPVAHEMITRESGRIVLIGSIAAQRAMPDGIAYSASKAGMEGMTRRLAFDLGKYGITANLVAPGVIRTSIRATSTEILGSAVPDTNVGVGTDSSLMDQLIPLRRGGLPEEVAATVFFLASRGAAYINGEVVHVDGGWIAS